ncbi:MAG TPA: branched-chain amino acid ABC transporter permease, partial [Smithellaceae bacterium]|nr:branched-chain amino acid ABC transporter permease [Smithellaceae bacterium]
MKFGEELKKSFFIALGLILLTFPIMVIQVNTIENVVVWRWRNSIFIGLGGFIFSFFWLLFQKKKSESSPQTPAGHSRLHRIIDEPRLYRPALSIIVFLALIFPFVFSHYQVNIMTTALIYVMLGLGLNIEVGLAGLLDLGYVAFYAVGAYSYALLNYHFGLGFWTALPAGAILAAFAGILVGFPVLRLRGD